MFKQDATEDEISAEDLAFWNVGDGQGDVVAEVEVIPEPVSIEVQRVSEPLVWSDEPEAFEQLSLWQ